MTYLWSVLHPVISGGAEMAVHLSPVKLGRAGEWTDHGADSPLQLTRSLVKGESSADLKHKVPVIFVGFLFSSHKPIQRP